MIPYAEAMREYGIDKPDLRNPIDLGRIRAFPEVGIQACSTRLLDAVKNEVWAIPAPGGQRDVC